MIKSKPQKRGLSPILPLFSQKLGNFICMFTQLDVGNTYLLILFIQKSKILLMGDEPCLPINRQGKKKPWSVPHFPLLMGDEPCSPINKQGKKKPWSVPHFAHFDEVSYDVKIFFGPYMPDVDGVLCATGGSSCPGSKP